MAAAKRLRIGGPVRSRTPSAYRRPGYPLAGCSPAEPTSVSPGEAGIPGKASFPTSSTEERHETGESVAKEGPICHPRMGSTSGTAGALGYRQLLHASLKGLQWRFRGARGDRVGARRTLPHLEEIRSGELQRPSLSGSPVRQTGSRQDRSNQGDAASLSGRRGN